MHSTALQPTDVGAPAASYALAMETPAGSRWIHTAGIVATRTDGTIPSSLAEQAHGIWEAVAAILRAGRMGLAHIVSYTTYVVAGEDLGVVMAARDAALAGHRAASTLIVVPALARPEWRMEIAVIAAAEG
jgi:enamine deaminase RidA (YjgF/YER057c/UK114 family)